MATSGQVQSDQSEPAGGSTPTELPSCIACDTTTRKLWTCIQCGHYSFCDDCWANERPHRKGARGIDNRPHEKVDLDVVKRLELIFNDKRTEEDQNGLFAIDAGSLWFGMDKDTGSQGSLFSYSDRLLEIMAEHEDTPVFDRFPQVASFVGGTGEGKSTVIQMLVTQRQAHINATTPFPAPVNGLTGDHLPTSGDVHLYSDPATHRDAHPILFADCEGLSGGETLPRAKQYRDSETAVKKLFQTRLRWAKDMVTASREHTVKSLFPRILYTFSDVIVFVIQESRRFESDVLVNVVNWASSSIEKSTNQPVLPHLIIALNRTDNSISDEEWDPEAATENLLKAHQDITQVPGLVSALRNLELSGKIVKSAKDLLECFYRTITVIRIPTKGRYMQIDHQIRALYTEIKNKCTEAYRYKKSARMALNAQKLHDFMSAAFDHFAGDLDQPFDFVKQALRLNPMPRDFDEHIRHLILAVRQANVQQGGTKNEMQLLNSVNILLASCMMLIITRKQLAGIMDSVLDQTFREPLKKAFEDLCNNWIPCGFQSKGRVCCNVRSAHLKGHQQASNGRIFDKGPYQPRIFDDQFEGWFNDIGTQLKAIEQRLTERKLQSADERELVWEEHLKRLERFYKCNSGLSKNHTNATCFCCVNETPEHFLPCGHSLCSGCVNAFGGKMNRGTLTIRYCPFDRDNHNWEKKPVQLKFKPADAGTRTLTLDGGGVRGLAELILLEELQEHLGSIDVQNFFDLIVGTSTGGIIALILGVKNLPVSDCIPQFRVLCKRAFTSRTFKWSSWYKTRPLKESLQEIFGPAAPLFGGVSEGPRSQIKVAVTSSLRIAKANTPVLFTNYTVTGAERGDFRTNYKVLRSTHPKEEMKIWEAALATSAAPPYFKPFVQEATGRSFMDGGLHYNCPVLVADSERRVLWRDVQHQQPDMVLSLGTGLGRDAAVPQNSHLFRGGVGSWINMIWGMVQSQLDSEKAWDDYIAHVVNTKYDPRDRQRYIRLNVHFDGLRPGLDKIDQLGLLERTTRAAVKPGGPLYPLLQEAADRLVASCFYLEKPRLSKKNNVPVITGSIRCRFDEESPDSKRLAKLIRDRNVGDFQPHFKLQTGYELKYQGYDSTLPVHTPKQIWDEMAKNGKFEVPIDIPKTNSNFICLSLCLRPPQPHAGAPDDYLPISGFPRSVYLDPTSRPASIAASPGSTRPNTSASSQGNGNAKESSETSREKSQSIDNDKARPNPVQSGAGSQKPLHRRLIHLRHG